jgi:hypothetical protein
MELPFATVAQDKSKGAFKGVASFEREYRHIHGFASVLSIVQADGSHAYFA